MRLHMTLDHEVDVLEHQFARNTVDTVIGVARFLDPHHVEVLTQGEGTKVYHGERILLAVGTTPFRPADVPFNGRHVLDSDEIVEIDHLPRSLTVIGAGVIGLEYATIFSALDVAVTLVDAHETFLDFIDRELIDDFTHQLRDRGMTIRLGSKVTGIEFENDRPVTVRKVAAHPVEMLLFRWPAGPDRALTSLTPGWRRITGAAKVDPQTFQTRCRTFTGRRRDRLSEPRVDVDGTGKDRRLPRLRHEAAAGTGVLPVRHLHRAGNLHRRHERTGGEEARHPVRVRHRPVPGNLARAHHGAEHRHFEDDLFHQHRAAPGRASCWRALCRRGA